jgi:signal peptidase I
MTAQNTIAISKPRPSLVRVIVIGRNSRNTLIRIFILVVVCFIVFNFILLPIRVTGISTLTSHKDRSINFVNRLAYLRHEPHRGDVVSIRYTRKQSAAADVTAGANVAGKKTPSCNK